MMKNEATTGAVKKKTTRKTTVRKTLKPVAKRVKVTTVEDNLKKLAASRVPSTFVKEHDGVWDHAGWLQFLDILRASLAVIKYL